MSREAGEEWDDQQEDLELESEVGVEHLSGCRFRVVEPISLSFMGPFGLRFHLGDVIAARAKDDGRYEYVGIIQRGEVWSFRHTIGPYRHPPQRASDPTLGPTLPHLDAEAILDDRVVRGSVHAARAVPIDSSSGTTVITKRFMTCSSIETAGGGATTKVRVTSGPGAARPIDGRPGHRRLTDGTSVCRCLSGRQRRGR